MWGFSPAADAAAERALDLLSAAGAEIVEGVTLPALKDLDDQHELTLMLVELKVSLARYLGARESEVATSTT